MWAAMSPSRRKLLECGHTHITRLDHLEKLGAWHKLGVCVFKCCFAGPKGTKGGECWLEERWTVLAANEKMTHVDTYL